MVANRTAFAWSGSLSRNSATGVRKAKASPIATAARNVHQTIPTPSVYVGRVETPSSASSSSASSSSSETPKVRMIVPGFEARWITWVTIAVRKKSSA